MEGPRLTWPGRGRAVVVGAGGRWRFGERPEAPPQLTPALKQADRSSLLVHGEAHDALVALAATHAGRIRLCYIDPPFMTGQGFEHYDDRAPAGVWLAGMEERLLAARALLAPGAFVVVHVGEAAQAPLRLLLDELFGAERRLAQIVWQRSPDRTVLGQGRALVPDHVEYLLVYSHGAPPADWPRPQRVEPFPAKTLATYSRRLVPSKQARLVDEFDDDAGGRVKIFRHASFTLTPVPAAARARADGFDSIMRTTNQQPESTFQTRLIGRLAERDVLYRAEFVQSRGKHKGARARYYLNGNVVLWLRDVARLEGGRLVRVADLDNLWTADEIPVTGVANEGGVSFRRGKKPERLLARVIEAFSRPGDAVLDFFAGSGTTGAVAARLGRAFVLVEHGAQAVTHIVPRLAAAGAEVLRCEVTR